MILLTARAADRLRDMRSDSDGELLRVSSCCAGRRYVLEFDDATRSGDIVGDSHGTLIVVDEADAELFDETVIDYDEARDAFSVDGHRPVSAPCACGASGDDGPGGRLAGGEPEEKRRST